MQSFAPSDPMPLMQTKGLHGILLKKINALTLVNSFPGLVRHHQDIPIGSVRPVTWLEVEGWISLGGSEIGTNRDLPSKVGIKETR